MRETETSAPSLRELSEAATPGPWYTVDTPWGEGDWIVAGNPDPHAGEFVCLFDGSVVGVEEAGKAAENAAFVARLETDYRAGRLIDPTTMAEAVASARAEGLKEGLERAAALSETHQIAPGTERFVFAGHVAKSSAGDEEFIGLSVARAGMHSLTAAIRALIPGDGMLSASGGRQP